MSEPKAVYAAICAVAKAMSAEGIAKARNNQAQGFKFRGIDDVYNALSGPMSDAGLVMLPRCLSRSVDERQTNGGKPLFYVTIECEFDLVAASDGSVHTIRTYGEAMDSADKATNKAMSAAYKYAAMQAFCIPTEGDNDADAHTPEPRRAPAPSPRPAPALKAAPAPSPAPAGKSIAESVTAAESALVAAGIMAATVHKVGKPLSEWGEPELTTARNTLKAFNARTDAGKALDRRVSLTIGRILEAGIPVSEVELQYGKMGNWSHDDLTKITASLPGGAA